MILQRLAEHYDRLAASDDEEPFVHMKGHKAITLQYRRLFPKNTRQC
jgi:hypothetical protein